MDVCYGQARAAAAGRQRIPHCQPGVRVWYSSDWLVDERTPKKLEIWAKRCGLGVDEEPADRILPYRDRQ
jgi:hypothetical protein